MDMNPIRSSESKLLSSINQDLPQIKLPLGAVLKIEIAKKQGKDKHTYTEAAYVLEEILQAVEKGKDHIPGKRGNKAKIINRVVEEK